MKTHPINVTLREDTIAAIEVRLTGTNLSRSAWLEQLARAALGLPYLPPDPRGARARM